MSIKQNDSPHQRRSIRLKDYDYRQPGAYFVTICTHQRQCLFGQVKKGTVELNEFGQIVQAEWLKSPLIRRELELDVFVILPNHLHGIVSIISGVGANGICPPAGAIDRVGANGICPPAGAIDQPGGANSHSPLRLQGAAPRSLGSFITGFKAAVTKQINQLRRTPGQPVWQRNYYEHIIRSERALQAIRQYIEQNPLRWDLDRYNPEAVTPDPQAAALWALLQEKM